MKEFREKGYFTLADGKISVTNVVGELVATIISVVDEIMSSTVATALGIQPLIPSAGYPTERAKLATFKE